MSNPESVLAAIHKDADDLDLISKALHEATAELDDAEQVWDERYDLVMASLEDEFAEAGRKSVPEHTALSAARRQHRAEHQRLQRAKRRLSKIEKQLQAKKAALNGRQSELAALRGEMSTGASDRPATHTYGARRAA